MYNCCGCATSWPWPCQFCHLGTCPFPITPRMCPYPFPPTPRPRPRWRLGPWRATRAAAWFVTVGHCAATCPCPWQRKHVRRLEMTGLTAGLARLGVGAPPLLATDSVSHVRSRGGSPSRSRVSPPGLQLYYPHDIPPRPKTTPIERIPNHPSILSMLQNVNASPTKPLVGLPVRGAANTMDTISINPIPIFGF